MIHIGAIVKILLARLYRPVIARLYDPERETVYRELGIDTICPTLLSGKVIDRLLDGSPAKEAFS